MALAFVALSLGYSARVVAAWLAGEAGLTFAVADGLTRLAQRDLRARRKVATIEKFGVPLCARIDTKIAAFRNRKTR